MKSATRLLALAAILAAPIAGAQEAIFITNAWEVPASEPDPPLHPDGLARAAKWAEVLRYADIDAVFSSDRRRNIQSAEPLAQRLRMDVVQFPKYELDAFAERLKRDHAKDRVFLSIGGNTVFPFIQAMGFDVFMRSMTGEDITLVIPRPDEQPVVILLRVP